MKSPSSVVHLGNASAKPRLLKQSAIHVFRTIRLIAGQAKQTPAAIRQFHSDLKDAWEESILPKA